MRISDWSSDVCSSDLCRISGQIFAILAAEIVRHVDIAVKHDISFGKLEGQHPVQAHRAGKGGRRKIDLRLGGDGGRNAGTKAYLPKDFDLLMRIGPVEGYRTITHRANGRLEFYAPRSEGRRAGTACVSTGRSGWAP